MANHKSAPLPGGISWDSLEAEGLLQPINKTFTVQGKLYELDKIFFHIDKTVLSIKTGGNDGRHFVTAYLADENNQYSYLLESVAKTDCPGLYLLEFGPVHPQSEKLSIIIDRWSILDFHPATPGHPTPEPQRITVISPYEGPRAMTTKGEIRPGYRFPSDVSEKMKNLFEDLFLLDSDTGNKEEPLFSASITIDRSRWQKYYYEIPIYKSYSLGALQIFFEKISGWRSGIRLHYKAEFPPPLKGTVEKRWQKCWEDILDVIRTGKSKEEIIKNADPICRYHPTQEGPTSISFNIITGNPEGGPQKEVSYHTISPYEEWISHFLHISLLLEYAEYIPLKEPIQVFIEPKPQKLSLEFEFEENLFDGQFIIHQINIDDESITITHESAMKPVEGLELFPVFELVDEKMNRYVLISRSLPIEDSSGDSNNSGLIKSVYGRSPLPYVVMDRLDTRPHKLVLQFKYINVRFTRPKIWPLI